MREFEVTVQVTVRVWGDLGDDGRERERAEYTALNRFVYDGRKIEAVPKSGGRIHAMQIKPAKLVEV